MKVGNKVEKVRQKRLPSFILYITLHVQYWEYYDGKRN